MKKIMFYCQYLTGMGHLVRSTEIIRSLLREFQVYLVNGGPIIPEFKIPSDIKIVQLPALWIEDGQLQVDQDFPTIEAVKEHRKNQLIAVFDQLKPDALITEFFPFGRHKLIFELIPLLDYIQINSPTTKIICSVRDIVGRTDLAQEEEIICQLTRQYFDLILFHSDLSFQKLEESFSNVQRLNCEVQYTGFVAQSNSEEISLTDFELINLNHAKPMILVSIGGGRIGYELLEKVIEVSPILKSKIPHQIQIFTGPFIPEDQFFKLQQLAYSQDNVNLRRYTSNLMAYMEKADLSISLTGYNTTMNILKTGVRSLVVPIGHYSYDEEQLIRTQKLEKMGIVEVLNLNSVDSQHFAQKIIDCLNQPYNSSLTHSFDLNGAEKTTLLIKNLLRDKVLV